MAKLPPHLKSKIEEYHVSNGTDSSRHLNKTKGRSLSDYLKFEPSEEQSLCAVALEKYFLSDESRKIFILKGTAGSGKTSISAAFMKWALSRKGKVYLCAPTGRAAKVLSASTQKSASTIHRLIYSPKERKNKAGDMIGFQFIKKSNKEKRKALYIVDEASMISTSNVFKAQKETSPSLFKQNNLLEDLLEYIFQANEQNKVLFVGDRFQLPPVGEEQSPALAEETFHSIDFNVESFELRNVKRQAAYSAILETADELRRIIRNSDWQNSFQPLWSQGELEWVRDKETACDLFEEMYTDDSENTVFLCYTNKNAADLNARIRKRLWPEGSNNPQPGDRIMVVKNHYYRDLNDFSLIANGESGNLMDIDLTSREEIANMEFAKAIFEFEDIKGAFYEYRQYLNMSLLNSPKAGLSGEEMKLLYASAKRSRRKYFSFLQALEVKYGYAITGHKAQGGEWNNVFVLLDSPTRNAPMYSRWFYTAITRARNKLFLVNPF